MSDNGDFDVLFLENLLYLKVPLHTVIKLTPVAFGCRVEFVALNIPPSSQHSQGPALGLYPHFGDKFSMKFFSVCSLCYFH